MPDQDLRTITKRELVNRIAEETGQTKVVVRDVLQRFLDSVIDELSVGNRLEFRDFGVFEVRVRAARVAQNPRTLVKVPVPAKRVVKFKVGRVMRRRVCDEPLSADESGSESSVLAGGGLADGTGSPLKSNGVAARDGQSSQVQINGMGASGSASEIGEDRVESEDRKPQPPTPPPSKPGSPF